jgi:hypothetical protein
MTWQRKVQGVVVALFVFAVFVIPGADWIDGFIGSFS